MSKAPRLTSDRTDCPVCGYVQDREFVEDRLLDREFSACIKCNNCKTSVEYYFSSNGFITRRIKIKKKK